MPAYRSLAALSLLLWSSTVLAADPVCTDLRAALNEYTGFSSERIVAGAGTAELTERMLHAFLDAGDAVITCPPSLPQHNPGASRARVTLVQVPRTEKFEIDPDAIVTAMRRQTNIKMVMLSWATYPSLDPNFPAGLSSTIIQNELRGRLGFTGVTITDSLTAVSSSNRRRLCSVPREMTRSKLSSP